MKAKIIGIGTYAPGDAIDNLELKELTGIEFNHEKTELKLGIAKRHMAKLRGLEETTADFATKAAMNAIKNAGIDPKEVGLFIVGTDTPEHISPATALLVQGRIQEEERWGGAFDIAASCASFTTALDTAARMVAHDPSYKYAVVTGVYNMPAFVKEGDVFGLTIFADGAGAVVLEKTDDSDASGYIDGQFIADGTQWDYIGVYAGGTRKPITKEILDNNDYGLQLLQRLPGDRNVRLWPMVAEKLAEKAGLKLEEIDHFIFTQINKSVIVDVMKELGRPMSDTTCVMDRYGYTGSACVPMAFEDAVNSGKVKKGDKVMFIASGAGFAVGANVFTY